MNSGNAAASLALFLVIVISASCGDGNANANSSNTSVANSSNAKIARTNVEELGMLINVPYESDEVFWKEDVDHKKLIAVLRFPQGEANRLISDAEKIHPAQQVTITPESWFPAELEAQSEMSPDDTLSGQAYAANAFFQDPYNQGRITHIQDTDYFILELSQK